MNKGNVCWCMFSDTVSNVCLSLSQVQQCDDDGDVRLFNGANSMEGRVQVYIREIWTRVCGFLGRDEEDVVCKQMGYLRGGEGILLNHMLALCL